MRDSLNNTENILKENYDLIWKKFLQLEIKRSCEAVKLAGSANLYLILQVIAWHNFLLVTDETDTHSRIDIFDKWVKKKLSKNKKYILTYTLISELTALPLETVRRNVKKLIEKKWVKYSKNNGVEFHASQTNNKKLTEEFNVLETSLVIDFISKVNLIQKNNNSVR